ncbi:UNVERIFIED_CONTAM: Pentatricopeptide repeat-containing protein [Sesamum radiatum]|uniref:Pentatricopeptide repeat-containing protein n=1 Tax=Sesamum radiatum TaxID=300843 RepID=A0AAW2PZQ4_SESRA
MMKLFLKRNYTSLSRTHCGHYHSTTSQIIQLCRAGSVSDAILLLSSIKSTPDQQNAVSKPIIYATVVHACTKSLHFTVGLQLHCHLIKSGLETDRFVGCSLLELYNIWVHSRGRPRDAIEMYLEMLGFDTEPNAFTLSAVIKACSEVGEFKLGKSLHSVVVRCGFESNEEAWFFPDWFTFGSALTALGNLERLKQGKEVHAQRSRNVFLIEWRGRTQFHGVLCLVAIVGRVNLKWLLSYSEYGEGPLQFRDCFTGLCWFGCRETWKGVTLPILEERQLEGCRGGISLVDLYAKCGCVDFAYRIFLKMPVKNLITWNSMIGGFAQNGRGEEAVRIFDQMIQERVKPDYISFIEVLFACSHSGLVDQGRKYFISMYNDYGLKAGSEHYSCMVDLLGRAGKIEEAEDLIVKSEFRNNPSLWAALLGACATTTILLLPNALLRK